MDQLTWAPTVFLSFFEEPKGVWLLHQMWANVLGQTEWRQVESRNIEKMKQAYAECQAFNERES